ncbi:MAG: UDP-N-acetylmuramoyl-tripeptide--D-alanyl-D-alanine ligase [Pseudomonadales bacterium]
MIKAIRLSSLASLCDGSLRGDDCSVTSVSTDTRTLEQGDLFIALQGENFDARQFLSQAEQKRASAAIVAEYFSDVSLPQIVVPDTLLALGKIAAWNRQQFAKPVVGLTGSVGKTSCKELLASILRENGDVLATSGNLNNEIGVPLTLLRLEKEHDYAVIEMGAAQRGDIEYLGRVAQPDLALITTVAEAHLDGFKSIENIAATKAEIYQSLGEQGIAVINIDNDHTRPMLDQFPHCKIVSFSASGRSATVSATNIKVNTLESAAPATYSFTLEAPGFSVFVSLSVPGEFMVSNALAAAACAYALGFDAHQIKRGIESFSGFRQRMKTQPGIAGSLVIDDSYNANPASMRAAIDVLSSMSGSRVLVMGVMAELGPDSERLHREIGEYALDRKIDHLVCLGSAAQSAASAFSTSAQLFESHQQCIEHCNELAQSLDQPVCFLVKGSRSAKMEKIVANLSMLEGAI